MTNEGPWFKAVLFDLDGTLLDTLDDIAAAANAVLASQGAPAHPPADYRRFIGDGVATLFSRALPKEMMSEEVIARCVAGFGPAYADSWNERTAPYDGIAELLAALRERGLRLAVLSNKPHLFTLRCVEHYFPDTPFLAVVGDRPPIPRKPDPASALEIAASLKVDPGQVVYVGDSSVDMLTASRAGMLPIGVAWGFRSAAELREHGACAVIEHPRELLDLLDETGDGPRAP
jgi:phosphoglycolate phosphatase